LTDTDVNFLQALCDALRICARQVDSPANELHSESYAAEAIQLVDELNAGVTKVLIKGEDLKAQGFGGIYNVGKAARNPPIFLCFSHKPEQSTESYALVGKGIVFDTGLFTAIGFDAT
jgi:leucyl aminopeptidase